MKDKSPAPVFQISPDWTMQGIKEEIEKELARWGLIGFKFKGPGMYYTKTDSVLVVPMVCESKGIDRNSVWHQRWPEETIFNVNVFNTTFENLIFAALHWGAIPTRQMLDDE